MFEREESSIKVKKIHEMSFRPRICNQIISIEIIGACRKSILNHFKIPAELLLYKIGCSVIDILI
ncbi:hypothetical protein GILI108418_16420 [Gillisia limnaea]|uniref:Uncharacterized protein n=1 Tax=Gillisia limnaea (strain DSM 15749 / LMG 21470 / R-8282) TaxID=865937 RepID=H2BR16_GILLR|nr:hypothetical protein Gilli_0179 [Gillisia limnaea DSM 15749]